MHSFKKIIPVATILLAFGAAGAACSDDESVFNAEVGECIESVSGGGGEISELPETDCDEDHEAQFVGLVEHEGDDDEFDLGDIQAEAQDECAEAFEDFTGTAITESALSLQFITPTESTWEDGDRETICVAIAPDDVDETFEDNGEDFLLASGDSGSGDSGSGSGEDTSLDDFADLVDDCEGGDDAACDDLWLSTPVGSDAERVGATCGGRSDTELDGACASTLDD